MNNDQEKHVTAIFDDRPGHQKQTEGILNALAKKTKITVHRIFIKDAAFWHTAFKFIKNLSHKHISPTSEKPSDLVICTGRRTHFTALLLKKINKVPAVTCMLPNIFFRHVFDLCFVPIHDGKSQTAKIITTSGAPNCCQNSGTHDDTKGLILLGGIDTKSHKWESEKLVQKIASIVEGDTSISWTIGSSPRTPEQTIVLLRRLDSCNENARFVDFKDTERGWVEKQYDQCGKVWITGDSISMMYEALTAGCRVGILPVSWVRKNCKFRNNETYMLKSGLAVSYDEWQYGGKTKSPTQNFNEAQKCADKIIELWQKKS